MNKAKKYAQNGALLFGIGNAFINAFNQLNSNDLNKKFEWGQFFTAAGKGAVFGGTSGFIIGTIRDKKMSDVFSNYRSVPNYLHKSLDFYKDDSTLLMKKAEQIKSRLHEKFNGNLIQKPYITGSVVKGTSIYGSDIDIQLPFKRDFGSVANVFNSVSDFIFDELNINEVINVRKQKHSIGIEFQINDEIKRIDIVPTRQIKKNNNDVQLFVNNTGFFEKPSYKKTNSVKQLSSLAFNYREKRIIRLLKIWKIENNLKIKSVHLEWLAKKSFEVKPITNKIEKDLTNTIYFIASNIENLWIVDSANSNNIISNSISLEEKIIISRFCYKMIDDLKSDKRNIIDYFPSLETVF